MSHDEMSCRKLILEYLADYEDSERGRVDEIQGLEDHRREESFLGRDVEEPGVESCDLAVVLDPEGITSVVRELVEQTSQ